MKILLLGGYGFIGSHVNKKLVDLGYDVHLASRRNGVDLCSLESIEFSLQNVI